MITNKVHIKLKNNWFLISLFTLFLISISNNFYQIKLFDKYEDSKKNPNKHLMINGDISDFWYEANLIDKEIQQGKTTLKLVENIEDLIYHQELFTYLATFLKKIS